VLTKIPLCCNGLRFFISTLGISLFLSAELHLQGIIIFLFSVRRFFRAFEGILYSKPVAMIVIPILSPRDASYPNPRITSVSSRLSDQVMLDDFHFIHGKFMIPRGI
jgi:hypothetical protein